MIEKRGERESSNQICEEQCARAEELLKGLRMESVEYDEQHGRTNKKLDEPGIGGRKRSHKGLRHY
eukprot:6207606-Pleurochrysis_carterae.AAC.2